MDGQRLYEERVLELVRQNVILSAKDVTNKTSAPYFVIDAPATPPQKLGNQDNDVHLENGDGLIINWIL